VTQPTCSDLPATGFVRKAQIMGALQISHATLWRLCRTEAKLKPTRLSPRISVWRAEDVHSWLKEKAQA